MSSRKAVTGNVGGESSNESGAQTEESSSRSFIFTTKELKNKLGLRTSPDGRYFFSINNSYQSVEIIDTLFKKKKILNFDFWAAVINGQPLAVRFRVEDYYAFDWENSLVLFDNSFYGCRVGTGVVNLEQSTVVIGQLTAILGSLQLSGSRFVAKSYPANLKDGFILKVWANGGSYYFDVKLDEQNQLQATRINSLSNVYVVAVHEGFAYSLDWQPIDDETQQNGQYVALSKRSLETGELSSYPTMNSEAMGELELTRGCRVGKQLFGYINYYSWPYKSQIVSLNLDTLEWNENWIKLDGTVNEMVTDGEHTLIIRVQRKDGYHYYYRFVVNKPYSLSTCVWRNLQSIVHSRPDVYNFICSKLPTNFRPPRPIEHSVPFDTEVRDSCTVETGKQNCKTSDESVDSSLAFVSDFASYCETLGYKRGPGERVPSRSPIGTTHSRFPSRCPDSRK